MATPDNYPSPVTSPLETFRMTSTPDTQLQQPTRVTTPAPNNEILHFFPRDTSDKESIFELYLCGYFFEELRRDKKKHSLQVYCMKEIIMMKRLMVDFALQ